MFNTFDMVMLFLQGVTVVNRKTGIGYIIARVQRVKKNRPHLFFEVGRSVFTLMGPTQKIKPSQIKMGFTVVD